MRYYFPLRFKLATSTLLRFFPVGAVNAESLDLNNIIQSGFYVWPAGAAKPSNTPTNNRGSMIVICHNPARVDQLAITGDGYIYLRQKNDNVWGSWVQKI